MSRVHARRSRKLKWLAVAVWAAVIFTLSTVPGARVPVGADLGTVGHFVEYAVLAGLLVVALEKNNRVLAAVALASAYGVTDELHQLLVPGRMSDPVDWAVDTAGAVVGAAVTVCLMRRATKRASAPSRSAKP